MPNGQLGRYLKAVKAIERPNPPSHVDQFVHRGHHHSVGHATD